MSFDREYYERYYYDPRTAVTGRHEMGGRARLIAAYTQHVSVPVRRILDAGCGTGLLRAPLKRYLPKATYTGIESSGYLCGHYGWQRAAIESFRSVQPYDLVICYDVLQYLDRATAARALRNLGRLCRGVLYFTALTRIDWQHNCDRERTDADVFLRSASWYRTHLQRSFREVGAGFWLRRGAPIAVWELESV
ncbi:MAG TPA: class I SAM-dependent methyltransferase [Steroidobacteraceae bacterium]